MFVRVELFDPVTEEHFPIHAGIGVSVAKLDHETMRVDVNRYGFLWNEEIR